jgi:hypothetical protein
MNYVTLIGKMATNPVKAILYIPNFNFQWVREEKK